MSVKSARRSRRASTPRGTSRSTSASRGAVPGSSARARRELGGRRLSPSGDLAGPGRRTDCSSWSSGDAASDSHRRRVPRPARQDRARTVRCRACSSCPASPTWAATSRARRSAWTSRWRTSSRGARGSTRPSSRSWTAPSTSAPNELTYPVFVKPARSGSSFGVSKVESRGRPGRRRRGSRQLRLQGR